MSKEVKLDDILVSGQQYIIWDSYKVIYRFKEKRTYIFELPDGSLTKFTNLQVEGVKLINGETPKAVISPKSVKVNSSILYKPVKTGNFMKDIESNFSNLKKIDQQVKEKGGILGRYIQEPYADGYAVYQIVEEKVSKVKIKHVTGLGDDWVLPVWGEEATIDKSYAQTSLYRRDKLADIFSKK